MREWVCVCGWEVGGVGWGGLDNAGTHHPTRAPSPMYATRSWGRVRSLPCRDMRDMAGSLRNLGCVCVFVCVCWGGGHTSAADHGATAMCMKGVGHGCVAWVCVWGGGGDWRSEGG